MSLIDPKRTFAQISHVRVKAVSLAASPARAIILAKLAVVKGAPRSDVSKNDESIDRQAPHVIHDKMHSAQTSGGRRVVE